MVGDGDKSDAGTKSPQVSMMIVMGYQETPVVETSPLKTKEILPHAKTWMGLEDVVLRETNQPQKEKHCMIPLLWSI